MPLQSWILPTLIGFISAILLVAILFKDNLSRQTFSDLGGLIQLQTSRPFYYGFKWVPNNYNQAVPRGAIQGQISRVDSPNWVDSGVPYSVYNYYPKAPLNPVPTQPNLQLQNTNKPLNSLAFTNPDQIFDPHKVHYWELSGGYPYPLPLMVLPPTDMDKVQSV